MPPTEFFFLVYRASLEITKSKLSFMPRVVSHSVDRTRERKRWEFKSEPATKGAISSERESIAYRVKRRNESDRMAQDATGRRSQVA